VWKTGGQQKVEQTGEVTTIVPTSSSTTPSTTTTAIELESFRMLQLDESTSHFDEIPKMEETKE